MYLTLIVVILSGITLGVVIPLGVPWFGKQFGMGHGRTKKLQKYFVSSTIKKTQGKHQKIHEETQVIVNWVVESGVFLFDLSYMNPFIRKISG